MDQLNHKSVSTIPAIKMVRPSPADRFKDLEKKDHSKEPNFVYSFRPVYYFSRMLGLMPFSIICNSKNEAQKPKVRAFDSLWFVVSICLYCLMAFVSYETRKHSRNSANISSNVLILGDSFHLITGLLFGALLIAMDMCNRNKLVAILRKFTVFDREVINSVACIIPKLFYISSKRRCQLSKSTSTTRENVDVLGCIAWEQ